jgi:predicted transcriptional regulator
MRLEGSRRTVPLLHQKGDKKKVSKVIEYQLSERFEVAFNQIHSWLQRSIRNADTDRFTELLRIGFPAHSIIRKYYHDLRMFAKLRNSIVHDKVELGFYIAEPHARVVELIENIAALLLKQRSALTIATRPVFYYSEDAKLTDILTVINKKSYSVFPIYHADGYKWLLTSECIIQYFADHMVNNAVQIGEVKVKDLYTLRKSPAVEFVKKDVDMFEIEDVFEDYHLKNQKLEAVILTETGKQHEKPIGIITSWDLVEIDVIGG